jgi:hypothetical protein
VELWEPLTDLTYEQALENIHLIVSEQNSGVMDRSHLIDDYVLSRNIAKYGLKFVTLAELLKEMGQGGSTYLWHEYTISTEEKVKKIKEVLEGWGLAK